MKGGERRGQPLVIASQSSKPVGPSKGTFRYPTLGQEHKASFGFLQFNDDQPHTMSRRRRSWLPDTPSSVGAGALQNSSPGEKPELVWPVSIHARPLNKPKKYPTND